MKSATRPTPQPQAQAHVSPLEPRRTLFWTLAGILLLWMIALFAMYWFTVRPERLKPSAELPAIPIPIPTSQP